MIIFFYTLVVPKLLDLLAIVILLLFYFLLPDKSFKPETLVESPAKSKETIQITIKNETSLVKTLDEQLSLILHKLV
jgi:hypothetical protein